MYSPKGTKFSHVTKFSPFGSIGCIWWKGKPGRTLALQKGKPALRPSALRAPWVLSPDLANSLRRFLRQWHPRVLAHQVPCHVPSFKTIFTKHSSIVDILCNHTSAVQFWSFATEPSYAAAKDGTNTNGQLWTPNPIIGSFLDLCSGMKYLRNFPFWQRALSKQSLSLKIRLHTDATTRSSTMVQRKRTNFPKINASLWDRTCGQPTSHLHHTSHHPRVYPIVGVPLPERSVPGWGQTCILAANLLSLPPLTLPV